MKNLNELRDRAYKTACEYGFHDKELSNEHCLMLVITELSEAVEADRKGHRANADEFQYWFKLIGEVPHDRYVGIFTELFEKHIKDTVEDELADAVIRLLDLFGLRGMDAYIVPMELMPDCHTFTEHMFRVCRKLTDHFINNEKVLIQFQLSQAMSYILAYCERNDIDLSWHIEQKMRYNELRPIKHGEQYKNFIKSK